jgi:hypothetical protein
MLFGNAPISTTRLLQIVTSQVPGRAKSESRRDWTEAAKQVLCGLAKKCRLTPYASIHLGSEKHEEWLLDIVWHSVSGGTKLAVESEWGKLEHVQDDFEKLMSIKSPLKLMLFKSGNTRLSTAEVVQTLQGDLAPFKQNVKGETYLLVDFRGGEHQCYKFRVPHNGKLKAKEVRFSHLKRLSGPDVTRRRSPA